jgi:hypothetical protein
MSGDDLQSGGPVVTRREPGWYDDPWNPANIRRWDGEEWTGETAPRPAAAPGRQPAAPGRQPGNAPSRGRAWPINPLVIAGVVAAIVVVGVVVMLSGHGGSSPTATTLGPAPAPTTAAPAGLPAAVLTAADIGTGWTAIEARPLTAAEFTQGPCGSAAWAHDTGGYLSSFVKGRSAATAHGSVITKVLQAPSLEVANTQQAVVEAQAFGGCLEQRVVGEVRSQLPPGESLGGATITPFNLELSLPSRAYVVSVMVKGPGGATRVVTDNAVAMFSGRYAAMIDVSWSSDAPLGGQIVQQEAAFEAAHLTALTGS